MFEYILRELPDVAMNRFPATPDFPPFSAGWDGDKNNECYRSFYVRPARLLSEAGQYEVSGIICPGPHATSLPAVAEAGDVAYACPAADDAGE